jgi:hypothetical protein
VLVSYPALHRRRDAGKSGAIRTLSVDFQPSGYTSARIRAAGITLDNPISTSAMDQRATGAVQSTVAA